MGPTTFCVIHDREWTGEQGEPCPWCKIERLRAVIRDAYIEGHEDGGQCWSDNFKPGKGYAQNDWLDSDARKAVQAAEREAS